MTDPLDIEQHDQLLAYLRETCRIAPDETPEVRTLAGGVSNRTVWVKRPATGEAWVLKQALAKLRVKVDWFSDPARVHREALGLRWLEKLAPPGTITPLVFEDQQHHLLAMQAVPEPHENWKTMLLAGRIEIGHFEQFGRLLHSIHGCSSRLPEVANAFDDRSFFESLRLEPYYGYTAEQVPEARAFLSELIERTRARRDALVHGDFSPKNVLVREGRLMLLDHEVIHWGDPSFDVGFAMTHFLSKAHHLPAHRRQMLVGATAFLDKYTRETRRTAVRQTLGCMLARVAGRSPVEYLDDSARSRQARLVVELMRQPPANLYDLIDEWGRRLDAED